MFYSICRSHYYYFFRQYIFDSESGIPATSSCREIGLTHFEAAMLTARKSVSATDVKKFESFRKSIQIAK